MKKSIIPMLSVLGLFLFFMSCASTPKRLDIGKDMVADSGELTLAELENTANKLAKQISDYFKQNPQPDGIFVALLPTKNETSEMIPVNVFDNTLLNELRKNGIFAVRTETRTQSLTEIQFGMTGMAENPLSVGKMKSPNYFVRTDITETMYRSSGDKIVEQAINTELINVSSQIMAWGDKILFRKKAVSSGKTGW